jgi:hypothetical protein
VYAYLHALGDGGRDGLAALVYDEHLPDEREARPRGELRQTRVGLRVAAAADVSHPRLPKLRHAFEVGERRLAPRGQADEDAEGRAAVGPEDV